MEPTAAEVAAEVTKEAGNELQDAVGRIKHCVGQLREGQVWWRPAESMNSIGNLILHLCGNVRQWIVCGVGGAADDRDRPREFSERGPIPTDELLGRLDAVVTEAKQALAKTSAVELLAPRRIQGFDVTGMRAIFQSVAHFRGHTQEIVHVTRSQLGDAYEFDFVPTSPEQGGPSE